MIRTVPRWLIYSVLIFQVVSSTVFLSSLWGDVLYIRTRPLPYVVEEITQILASVGLILGPIMTVLFIRRSQAVIRRLDQQIGAVSGGFEAQVHDLFRDWGLSQSEQEITIYAMKGFSNAEIGALRGTSVATVKSQMNAIYRKSEFANRQQLIAFMVEELLDGVDVPGNQPVPEESLRNIGLAAE
ncbi:hypothetical protein HKCCE4037_04740 [Rhodobacterales bacterium HKCCE4037]|nr:hypothetical protein [Rhodobacterales bacterium HKCCE4037]